MTLHVGSLKWTISRARDTAGYNVCTLYVDGKKVGRASGGNYDMVGTCFGEYIESFQDRLLRLAEDRGDKLKRQYGTHYDPDAKLVAIDGAVGIRSMERLAEEIGITWKVVQQGGRDKDDQLYRIEIGEMP